MAGDGALTDQSVTATAGGALPPAFVVPSQLIVYGRFAEADRALERLAAQASTDEELVLAATRRASNRFWHLDDADGAHRILDEAAARVGDGAAGDGILVMRALLWLYGGRTTRAVASARLVRRRQRTLPGALLLGASLEALGYGVRGEVERIAEVEPRGPLPPAEDDGIGAFQHGILHLTVGLARAMNGADPAPDDGTTARPGTRAAMAAACEGTALLVDGTNLLWAGRIADALDVLERAAAHLRRSDRLHTESAALGQLAYCRALLGDAGGATRDADEARRRVHPLSRFETFFVERAGAWAAAVRGELSDARERLAATGADCRRRGQAVLAAQAWHDVARLGDAERAAPPLRSLAGAATGGLVPELAAHVRALADGDAAGVARAALRARQRRHRLHAAEAAAQSALLWGRGRRADAEHRAAEARALLARCQGARTPALARLAQLDLTPREREVVGLVARGLTNREVARRLQLSVRTVENHLQAGFGKLGVHRRQDLVPLHGSGLDDLTVRSAPADGDGPGAPVGPGGEDLGCDVGRDVEGAVG